MPTDREALSPQEVIDYLRGHLQNCVNHLDRANRRLAGRDGAIQDAIRKANTALYSSLHAQLAKPDVPDGWKLVPVEPTLAMELAGKRIASIDEMLRNVEIYTAMLNAAPQPASGE